jgi:hypothetical protein
MWPVQQKDSNPPTLIHKDFSHGVLLASLANVSVYRAVRKVDNRPVILKVRV